MGLSAVLIVDDESRIRELLARWLVPAGYTVHEADSAESALALLAEHAFAVALCDVQMPGKGGCWLIDRLREQVPATAIVLATADDAVPPFVSLRGGVVDYLVKPFARERVLDAVARAIEWHRSTATRGLPAVPASDPLEQWIRPGH
ncbi:MAG: response regulator [Acidobacteria bacterium]|nr:response regulator [Acidobacteriota bacterium]